MYIRNILLLHFIVVIGFSMIIYSTRIYFLCTFVIFFTVHIAILLAATLFMHLILPLLLWEWIKFKVIIIEFNESLVWLLIWLIGQSMLLHHGLKSVATIYRQLKRLHMTYIIDLYLLESLFRKVQSSNDHWCEIGSYYLPSVKKTPYDIYNWFIFIRIAIQKGTVFKWPLGWNR